MNNKNSTLDGVLPNPSSSTYHERIFSIRATVQRKLRWMENNWRVQKSAQIQIYAIVNDAKHFHDALLGVASPCILSEVLMSP